MEKLKSSRIRRRTFLAIGAGAALTGVAGWRYVGRATPDLDLSIGQIPPDANPFVETDLGRLKTFEDLNIRHMSELDRLPWFEKDDEGQFRLRDDAGIGPAGTRIIDPHSHVGWGFGFGGSVDMTRRGKVEYFYDFERDQDVLFKQEHPSNEEAASISHQSLTQFVKTPARNRTLTAANVVAEMDRMNYGKLFLLPLAIHHQMRHVADTFAAASMDSRIEAFGAVYPKPWGPKIVAEIERQIAEHRIKAIKYHPVFQILAPDDPDMMKLFEWCEARDMLVYAHTGYTGKEPRFMREKSEPERFAVPLEAFPKLRIAFAHTGVRRLDQAIEVARRFDDQVWLEISGQAVPAISYVLQRYDTEKVMFGSDWPFYPLSVAIARSLVATEPCPNVREKLFAENAKRLFGLA
ncbi:MAG TPA: amidohydrolase family protein [Candidatus Bathyarchaeia archaeon]|nr:amidohydrolase family protein [Candidatus Bathyarchaeia archaeon]